MGRRVYERFSRNDGKNSCGIPEIVDTYLAAYYCSDEETKVGDLHDPNAASYQVTTKPPWQNMHFCFVSEGTDIKIVGFIINIETNYSPQIDHRFVDKAREELEQSPAFILLNEQSQSFFLKAFIEFQPDFHSICLKLKDGERDVREAP